MRREFVRCGPVSGDADHAGLVHLVVEQRRGVGRRPLRDPFAAALGAGGVGPGRQAAADRDEVERRGQGRTVRRLRRQRHLPALRRPHVRGLQGILQGPLCLSYISSFYNTQKFEKKLRPVYPLDSSYGYIKSNQIKFICSKHITFQCSK